MSANEFAFISGVRVGLRGIRRQARAHSRALVAIALVMVVLLGVFVAALPLSASAVPTSVAAAAPATPAASPGAVVAFGSSSIAVSGDCSGNINGSCIFSDIWNLFIGFFTITINSLGNAFGTIFNAFAGGIASMFQSWGFGLGTYGIWGPMMVVVSLGVAAFVAYLFLDGIGIERDLAAGESDL